MRRADMFKPGERAQVDKLMEVLFLPLDTAKHVQVVISPARGLMSTPRSQGLEGSNSNRMSKPPGRL